ncbi:unnamed protein product [Eruca vesicaria subsp. sativa]|uniref:Uncharacterized protein n=1 Tax=Eruca vesicaria subsp. sativa TaxID=29727 RepID=A0ABC8KH69_ERUVS|nr:unnamed protein product [Eruca vesicaria subsp. sativa]
MVMAANFFKLDSVESDTDEEPSKAAVQSKKKASGEKPDCDDSGKISKKKVSGGGDEIGNNESSKVSEGNRSHEKPLANTDDDDDDDDAKRKRKRVDVGDTPHKPKKQKSSVDPEAEVENNNDRMKKSTKDLKKKSKRKKTQIEVEEDNKDSTEDANQIQTDKYTKDPKKKSKKKKKKQIDDSEVEEDNKNSTEDANQIQTDKSTKDPKKKSKKKKQSGDPNNKDSTEDKDAEMTQTEAEENDLKLNSLESGKKKRNKKKKKKKKQSEDLEAEENNNNNSNNKGKEKRKKKKKKQKGDEVVSTPPSKSAKKVNFSDHVEVFPAESEESEDEEDEKVDLVRGKRFTKEEDELIKKSVLEYVDNHALGDEGINMVMNCQSHKKVKGCWKEIAAALPWRPYTGVYYRAHTLFEQGSKGVWSKEDLELVVEYQKKHGNDWRTLADAMGKHRNHVKDAWRRIRLASKKKGHWTMEEYQSLFDLVNKDLRIKAFKEKHSKHGMLRDNIPWMAISDQLGTRDHVVCCLKWYDQLTSPMVAKGIWANVDDYRLLEELTNLDAACVDDVDWDILLDNRDGDACRSRWNQMVNHIGIPGSKTFAEQVEVLSQRYCPDIAEDREDFDSRPFDPED